MLRGASSSDRESEEFDIWKPSLVGAGGTAAQGFCSSRSGTHENTADIGTNAWAQAKLEQHRETLRVWSYERFTQGRDGVVGGIPMMSEVGEGSLEAIMRGLKILAAIGMMQTPVKAEEDQQGAQLGWFQLVMITSMVWTAATLLAMIL